MADVTPEQRQQAIDVMTQGLIQAGIPEEDAPDLAESSVDEAISRGTYK